MQALKKLLIKLLEETAEKIKTDTCELTEEEAMDIMQVLAHKSLSREQACKYLNLSRSRFTTLIKEHKLPEGRKVRGYKELRWYEDELRIRK